MTMVYRELPGQQYEIGPDTEPSATVRIVGAESIALFKQMVRRANNCWDTAPAEMKEFSDVVTEGRILQDYQAQSPLTPTEKQHG